MRRIELATFFACRGCELLDQVFVNCTKDICAVIAFEINAVY